ncbi:MAG: DNA-directed RNA polymerase [Candidatus Micrarchaeaceae archaeon]
MYYVTTVKDTVSVPPKYIGKDITESAAEILRNKYERTMDKSLGLILAIFNLRDVSEGYIMPEDPNTHHRVTFDVLSFSAEVEEVVVGEVSELVEYGAFVRIGPVDALVHLSQITTDFVSFDRRSGVITSRSLGRTLKKGDVVYAKVSTVSMGNSMQSTKIALTMRPEGLGKPEWLSEAASVSSKSRKQKGSKR